MAKINNDEKKNKENSQSIEASIDLITDSVARYISKAKLLQIEETKNKYNEKTELYINNLDRVKYLNDLRIQVPTSDIPVLISFFSFINDDWTQSSDKYNVYHEIMPDVYVDNVTGGALKGQFIKYLSDKKVTQERIPFHILSLIIYRMSESTGSISTGFEDEKTRMNRNKSEITKYNPDLSQLIGKIINHCELSVMQADFIKKNMRDVNLQSIEVKSNLEALNETKENLYTDYVAILGIFSALIFGLFGGFQGLSTGLSAITESDNIGKIIVGSTTIMIGLLTVIYCLVQWIGHLIKRPLRSCGCSQNIECHHGVYKKHQT